MNTPQTPPLTYTPIRYDFGTPPKLEESTFPNRFRPSVPLNLICIRHAPSELNVLNDLLKKDPESVPKDAHELHKRPDNVARVVTGGEAFAKAAAEWLRANIGFSFSAAYVSPYVRARETAGHIGIELGLNTKWKVDSRIGERSYGEFGSLTLEEKQEHWKKRREDVRYWTPPNGEPLEHTELEARGFLSSISSRYFDGNVLAVSHGEFLLGVRMAIEYPSDDRLKELIADGLPNCGIVHYTRKNPVTGEIAPHYQWVRLIDPMNKKSTWTGEWQTIERKSYTSEELLAEAEKHPRFLKFSTRS